MTAPTVLRLAVAGDVYPVVLDRPCRECDGVGGFFDPRGLDDMSCGGCDGTGTEVTDEGHAVLTFVRRHTPEVSR